MARAKTTEKPPKAAKAPAKAKARTPKPEVAPEVEAEVVEAEVELTPVQACSVDFDPTADPFRG